MSFGDMRETLGDAILELGADYRPLVEDMRRARVLVDAEMAAMSQTVDKYQLSIEHLGQAMRGFIAGTTGLSVVNSRTRDTLQGFRQLDVAVTNFSTKALEASRVASRLDEGLTRHLSTLNQGAASYERFTAAQELASSVSRSLTRDVERHTEAVQGLNRAQGEYVRLAMEARQMERTGAGTTQLRTDPRYQALLHAGAAEHEQDVEAFWREVTQGISRGRAVPVAARLPEAQQRSAQRSEAEDLLRGFLGRSSASTSGGLSLSGVRGTSEIGSARNPMGTASVDPGQAGLGALGDQTGVSVRDAINRSMAALASPAELERRQKQPLQESRVGQTGRPQDVLDYIDRRLAAIDEGMMQRLEARTGAPAGGYQPAFRLHYGAVASPGDPRHYLEPGTDPFTARSFMGLLPPSAMPEPQPPTRLPVPYDPTLEPFRQEMRQITQEAVASGYRQLAQREIAGELPAGPGPLPRYDAIPTLPAGPGATRTVWDPGSREDPNQLIQKWMTEQVKRYLNSLQAEAWRRSLASGGDPVFRPQDVMDRGILPSLFARPPRRLLDPGYEATQGIADVRGAMGPGEVIGRGPLIARTDPLSSRDVALERAVAARDQSLGNLAQLLQQIRDNGEERLRMLRVEQARRLLDSYGGGTNIGGLTEDQFRRYLEHSDAIQRAMLGGGGPNFIRPGAGDVAPQTLNEILGLIHEQRALPSGYVPRAPGILMPGTGYGGPQPGYYEPNRALIPHPAYGYDPNFVHVGPGRGPVGGLPPMPFAALPRGPQYPPPDEFFRQMAEYMDRNYGSHGGGALGTRVRGMTAQRAPGRGPLGLPAPGDTASLFHDQVGPFRTDGESAGKAFSDGFGEAAAREDPFTRVRGNWKRDFQSTVAGDIIDEAGNVIRSADGSIPGGGGGGGGRRGGGGGGGGGGGRSDGPGFFGAGGAGRSILWGGGSRFPIPLGPFGLGGIAGAGFGSLGSLAGLGPEHTLMTLLGVAGSAGAGLAGAGTLAAGAAGSMAVGGGSDLAVLKSTITDTQTLYKNYDQLTQAQQIYGKGSAQAKLAQAQLNFQMEQYGAVVDKNGKIISGAGVAAELQLAKNVHALNTFWDQATQAARVQATNVLEQVVTLGHAYVPKVAEAAKENLTIINTGIRPLFSWLEGPQGMGIFDNLERNFKRNLPTAVDAFGQAVEVALRFISAASDRTGGFTQKLDALLHRLNQRSDTWFRMEVDKLVADFQLWEHLIGLVGADITALFRQDAGTGSGVVAALTGMLQKLHDWETSTRGKEQLRNIFTVHKEEVLTLMSTIQNLATVFGGFYLTAAPPLTKAMTGIISLFGDLLRFTTQLGPAMTDLVAAMLLMQKLGVLTTVLGAVKTALFGVAAGETAVATGETEVNVASRGGILAGLPFIGAGRGAAAKGAAAGEGALANEGGLLAGLSGKTLTGNLATRLGPEGLGLSEGLAGGLASAGAGLAFGGMGILAGSVVQQATGLRGGTGGTLAGGVLGGAAGFAIGGPFGAAIGAGIGSTLGPTVGHLLGGIFGSGHAENYGKVFASGFVKPLGSELANAIGPRFAQQQQHNLQNTYNQIVSTQRQIAAGRENQNSLGGRASGFGAIAAQAEEADQKKLEGLMWRLGGQAGQMWVEGLQKTPHPTSYILTQDFILGLRKLPPEARANAALTMIQFARQLEQDHKLPAGSVSKMITAIEGQFPQLRAFLDQEVGHTAKQVGDWMRFQQAQDNLKGFVRNVREQFGILAVDPNVTGKNVVQSAAIEYTDLRNSIKDLTGQARDDAVKTMKDLKTKTDQTLTSQLSSVQQKMAIMKDDIHKPTQQAVDMASSDYYTFAQNIESSIKSGMISAQKGNQMMNEAFKSTIAGLGGNTGFASKIGLQLTGMGNQIATALTPPPAPKKAAASGALIQIGRPGARGPDNVPVQIGNENIAVGEGEQLAVLNAPQQSVLNHRLRDFGGLHGFFRTVNGLHAVGGIVGQKAFAAGGYSGYALPLPRQNMGGSWSPDQGIDISAPGGTPEFAIGSGTITAEGIGGFGPNAPVLTLDQGPLAGHSIYYGHAGPDLVRVGQHVRAGQQISEVGYGIVGISTGPHIEIGFSNASGTPLGRQTAPQMAALLHALLGGAGVPDIPGMTPMNAPDMKVSGSGEMVDVLKAGFHQVHNAEQRYLTKAMAFLGQVGAGINGFLAGPIQAVGGGWFRTGATIDPTGGQTGDPGMTFAELLEYGTNMGLRPDLTQILGYPRVPRPPSMAAMAFGSPVEVRMPGSSRGFIITKNDIGSGQPGNSHFTVDLHPGIAAALGWTPNQDIEVHSALGSAAGTPTHGHFLRGGFVPGFAAGGEITPPWELGAQMVAEMGGANTHLGNTAEGIHTAADITHPTAHAARPRHSTTGLHAGGTSGHHSTSRTRAKGGAYHRPSTKKAPKGPKFRIIGPLPASVSGPLNLIKSVEGKITDQNNRLGYLQSLWSLKNVEAIVTKADGTQVVNWGGLDVPPWTEGTGPAAGMIDPGTGQFVYGIDERLTEIGPRAGEHSQKPDMNTELGIQYQILDYMVQELNDAKAAIGPLEKYLGPLEVQVGHWNKKGNWTKGIMQLVADRLTTKERWLAPNRSEDDRRITEKYAKLRELLNEKFSRGSADAALLRNSKIYQSSTDQAHADAAIGVTVPPGWVDAQGLAAKATWPNERAFEVAQVTARFNAIREAINADAIKTHLSGTISKDRAALGLRLAEDAERHAVSHTVAKQRIALENRIHNTKQAWSNKRDALYAIIGSDGAGGGIEDQLKSYFDPYGEFQVGIQSQRNFTIQKLLDERSTLQGTAATLAAIQGADGSVPGDNGLLSQINSLLAQQLQLAGEALAVSQLQYNTLANLGTALPPWGGSFAEGGIVPGALGEPRTIIAHGGEEITPPGKGGGQPIVYVVVQDGAVNIDRIKTVAKDAAVQVTRQESRAGQSAGNLPSAFGGRMF